MVPQGVIQNPQITLTGIPKANKNRAALCVTQ